MIQYLVQVSKKSDYAELPTLQHYGNQGCSPDSPHPATPCSAAPRCASCNPDPSSQIGGPRKQSAPQTRRRKSWGIRVAVSADCCSRYWSRSNICNGRRKDVQIAICRTGKELTGWLNGSTHLSAAMATRCSMDAVQQRTSQDVQMSHSSGPNIHPLLICRRTDFIEKSCRGGKKKGRERSDF